MSSSSSSSPETPPPPPAKRLPDGNLDLPVVSVDGEFGSVSEFLRFREEKEARLRARRRELEGYSKEALVHNCLMLQDAFDMR